MLAKMKQLSRGKGKGIMIRTCLFFSVIIAGSRGPELCAQSANSFTARLMNLEAAVNETFRYNAQLVNTGKQPVIYNLKAETPIGWNAAFKTEGSQVTSYRLDSLKTQEVTIEIMPSPVAKPGKYVIPVKAMSTTDTLTISLEAVVKGAYNVVLTTPTDRLSDEVTEGSSTTIHLVVRNTGSIGLDNLELSAQSPSQWEASFSPSKIERIDPGASRDVTVILKVPSKTIAGDYVNTFTVKNAGANANAVFRITVKTSLLAGWMGILIILAAIGVIYYLIRKYGRR